MALDSMRDLDDLDDDFNEHLPTMTTSTDAPATTAVKEEKEEGSKPKVGMLSPPPLSPSASPIRNLSFDMLLNCLSLLGDMRMYIRLRLVCKAWTPLAEHEALWKPLAFQLCKPAAKKKGSSSSCASSSESNQGIGTPSAAAKSGGQSAALSSGGGAAASSGTPLPRWVCRACALIQADPYGISCEFCGTQREIITSPPVAEGGGGSGSGGASAGASYCTKIGSLKEFAAMWSSPPLNDSTAKQALPLKSEMDRAKRDEMDRSRRAGQSGRVFFAGATTETVWDVAKETGDWYLLVKQTFLDRALTRKWETLDRG